MGAFRGDKIDTTLFWGTKSIDGVWATYHVLVTGACVKTVVYGVEDHQMFILDFLNSSLVGNIQPWIVCPVARRLNTNIHDSTNRYASNVED